MLFRHRSFVLVDEATFRDFHRRWRAIDRLWPVSDPEYSAIIGDLRNTARDELRREVKNSTAVGSGLFLIPI